MLGGRLNIFKGSRNLPFLWPTAMIVLVTTIAKIIQKRLTVFLMERMWIRPKNYLHKKTVIICVLISITYIKIKNRVSILLFVWIKTWERMMYGIVRHSAIPPKPILCKKTGIRPVCLRHCRFGMNVRWKTTSVCVWIGMAVMVITTTNVGMFIESMM